jgi:hypothetical protein
VYFPVAVTAAGSRGGRPRSRTAQLRAAEYAIEVDAAGATRSTAIRGRSGAGFCAARLGADGNGHWLVNCKTAPRAITQCQKELPQPAQHQPCLRRRKLGVPGGQLRHCNLQPGIPAGQLHL